MRFYFINSSIWIFRELKYKEVEMIFSECMVLLTVLWNCMVYGQNYQQNEIFWQ